MGEQKRSLREFLRHVNDYTYRFDPEKGRFRYRELRGVRDTAFDFYMWLKCWKDMIVFVAKCPVSAVRALFRYQWFSTYLTYPNLSTAARSVCAATSCAWRVPNMTAS